MRGLGGACLGFVRGRVVLAWRAGVRAWCLVLKRMERIAGIDRMRPGDGMWIGKRMERHTANENGNGWPGNVMCEAQRGEARLVHGRRMAERWVDGWRDGCMDGEMDARTDRHCCRVSLPFPGLFPRLFRAFSRTFPAPFPPSLPLARSLARRSLSRWVVVRRTRQAPWPYTPVPTRGRGARW